MYDVPGTQRNAEPSSPEWAIILPLGAAVGLILGGVLALIRHSRQRREDLAEEEGVPGT